MEGLDEATGGDVGLHRADQSSALRRGLLETVLMAESDQQLFDLLLATEDAVNCDGPPIASFLTRSANLTTLREGGLGWSASTR